MQAHNRTAWSASGQAIVAYVAALKLLLLLAIAGVYGLFIDELYFLACGEHLAWGYVDMPPLTAFQAWLARALFGDSMQAIRLFPALAAAGLVLLTGAIVRQLGGGRFAQFLAALAVALAPGVLAFESYLSMNAVELVIWTACVLILIRIIKTGNTRLWPWFGLLAGIGLLNKQTIILFGFALVVSLLFTPERRLMVDRWFAVGGVIAFLIFLPNLVWMIQHHFPHLELLANIRRNQRDVTFTPAQFLGLQAFFLNPVAAPIWIAGLWRLLVSRAGAPYRAYGLAYLVMLTVLLAMRAKVYYLGPAYPTLFGAGAVAVEAWLSRSGWSWTKPAYAALVALVATLMAPTMAPILPPETYIRYTNALGIAQPRLENRRTSGLPQFFADRCGWPEMAETVARVYHALPAAEQAKCAIFGNDFGQSGAIDFYGPKLGLPKSIGNHLTNWYWGPRDYTGEIVIVLGDTRESLLRHFDSVDAVAEVGHPYAMAQEHFTVFLCRKPKGWTFREIWPNLKNWN
jgi:hypothetical protein